MLVNARFDITDYQDFTSIEMTTQYRDNESFKGAIFSIPSRIFKRMGKKVIFKFDTEEFIIRFYEKSYNFHVEFPDKLENRIVYIYPVK